MDSLTNKHDNAGFMSDHRLQRWPNVKTALGQGVVFAGNCQLRGVICKPRPYIII